MTADEMTPQILEAVAPGRVTWSSLWRRIPDARITFAISEDAPGSTVSSQISVPSGADVELEPLRYRISQLINRDLRASFDQ
ncbi:MAG TPA: hypothetical protein VGN35_05155 [Jatrophihabitantaceae bacterium]|jgi:hypothetical protein|nr:hypothetical protein [Jatrophihabitantaceae bacterium]